MEYVPFNLTPNVVAGVDVNPATRKNVDLYGATLNLAALDSLELDFFNAQFPTLLGAPGSEERRIQLERAGIYLMGLRHIKHELKEPAFRGLNPGDTELGFGKIRPQFTRENAGYKANWNLVFAAGADWIDWLYETAGNAYAVGNDFGLVITHLVSLVTPTPFISEAHFKMGRTDLIPADVRPIKIGDNDNGIAHYPIPTMILPPKVSFYARALADHAGTDEIQLGGIVVGLGRVLKEEAATWAD